MNPTLRVATFNLRTGRALDGRNSWPLRRRATRRAIRELNADILGVQEAYDFQLRWLLRHLRDVEAVGDGRDADRAGEHVDVLVARRELRVIEHRTQWFGDTPDQPGSRFGHATLPRIATMTVVEQSNGARLHFTNTHLDHRHAGLRRRSVHQLLEWLDLSVPQVLVGDLNAIQQDPMFYELAQAGFRQALPWHAGGTVHGFSGRRDGRRIDHILVNEKIDVIDAEVVYGEPGARLPSDHWPVVAEIVLR